MRAVKIFFLIGIILSVLTSVNAFAQPGEINGDGQVNIDDFLIVGDFIAGIYDPSDEEMLAADVDESGNIDMIDLLCIIQIIFNIEY